MKLILVKPTSFILDKFKIEEIFNFKLSYFKNNTFIVRANKSEKIDHRLKNIAKERGYIERKDGVKYYLVSKDEFSFYAQYDFKIPLTCKYVLIAEHLFTKNLNEYIRKKFNEIIRFRNKKKNKK